LRRNCCTLRHIKIREGTIDCANSSRVRPPMLSGFLSKLGRMREYDFADHNSFTNFVIARRAS
jgi:hypothetical protein